MAKSKKESSAEAVVNTVRAYSVIHKNGAYQIIITTLSPEGKVISVAEHGPEDIFPVIGNTLTKLVREDLGL